MMQMRGIDRVFNFLSRNGFIRTTAYQFSSGHIKSVKIEHVEKICRLLNCTPNDLFEWKSDAGGDLPAGHALKSLVKDDLKSTNVRALLKDIPVEKLPEIEGLLKALKDG
jgi:succinate dehydrogenase flavin-adding protein (antitoxin of CptAB toxin-antitoxin module)